MGPKYFFVVTIRKIIKYLSLRLLVAYKFILKNRYFKNLCEFINSCDIHHLIYHFYFYEKSFYFFFFFFFFFFSMP